jgi:hypothetical protein
MEIIFNKISKPNAIFSVWEISFNGQITKFKIYGEKYMGNKNIYSVFNTQTKNHKIIGSLESAKARVTNFLIRGN